jgi:hypothetical protein
MPHERYTGPLPTIGDNRRLGMTGFLVECKGLYCHHERRFSFDELGLADDLIFIRIPEVRRFICAKCGRREFGVFGDWNEYYEVCERKRQEKLRISRLTKRAHTFEGACLRQQPCIRLLSA